MKMTQQVLPSPARREPLEVVDVVDMILDKGLAIDGYAQAAIQGVGLIIVDSRVVIGGLDTYLHFAEASGPRAVSNRAAG